MSARVIVRHSGLGITDLHPTDLEPEYSGTATYTIGDYVRVTTTETTEQYIDGVLVRVISSQTRRWQFIGPDGASGAHAAPTASGQTDWVFDGRLNHERPYDVPDSLNSPRPILTVAERADLFSTAVAPADPTTGLGIFRAFGTDVQVDVYSGFALFDDGGAGDVYSQNYPIATDGVGDSYYSEYFANDVSPDCIADFIAPAYAVPEARWGNLTLTGLRWPPGAYIKITVNNAGGTAVLGSVVPGFAEDIGATLVGASWQIENFGVQTFDGVTAQLVRRAPGAFVDVDVKLTAPPSQVRKLFERIINVPAAFQFSADHPEYDIYGVVDGNSPEITAQSRTHTFATIRVRAV